MMTLFQYLSNKKADIAIFGRRATLADNANTKVKRWEGVREMGQRAISVRCRERGHRDQIISAL